MREVFYTILIEFSAYFSLVAGILGLFLFVTMINSLSFLKKLGQLFNRIYSLKKMEKTVNGNIDLNMKKFLFMYSTFSGLCLCFLSGFPIVFLTCKVDMEKFAVLLPVKSSYHIILLTGLQSFQWFTVCALGFVFLYGILLLFHKKLAERLNQIFDTWYNLDEAIENKFEKTITKDVDTVSFLRNKHVGWTGLIISLFLILLAVINLLRIL